MILVNESCDIISPEYLSFLEEQCKNFKPEMTPFNNDHEINYFYRMFIDMENEKSLEMRKKAELYVNKELNSDKYLATYVWINRIDTNSNKNDEFHNDQSVVTLVIYLNDEFKGGELEYLDENRRSIKIPTKKNMSILMTNKVGHRVLPVTEGERFSLVFFFTIKDKKQKTLI